MKKFFLFCLLGAGAMIGSAQERPEKCPPPEGTPNITVQPRANALDFTTTFTDGSSATLFTVLNAGNTVVLDFFYAT